MFDLRPPFRPVPDVEIFPVDGHSAQLTFRDCDGDCDDLVEVAIGDRALPIAAPMGTGATTLDHLTPDTEYSIRIAGRDDTESIDFRTRSDIGSIQSRFATISDLHLGSDAFGPFKRIADPGSDEYTLRCAISAVRQAQDWGAELILLKGDLTEDGEFAHWRLFEELLAEIHVPVHAVPGNHDVFDRIEISPTEALDGYGLSTESVQTIDIQGVRIILADTTIAGRGGGSVREVTDGIVHAAASTDDPVFIGLHHNIQRTPIAWFWPPGIPSHNARPLIADLAESNDNVMISSGHTHRHRRHLLGDGGRVLFTEVGSTSDYPGTWAGYEVSDRAIRQVVRRIEGQAVIEWTERTRVAMGGLWPMWSQGALDDRCVDLSLRR